MAKKNKKEEAVVNEELNEEKTSLEVNEEEKEVKEEPKDELTLAKEQLLKLEAECEEAKKQRLIAYADLTNAKKRLEKEKEDAVFYANEKLIKELLIPMDNLDRALAAVKEVTEEIKPLVDGVAMISGQLMEILSNHGLQKIEASEGTEFNPEEHEACMVEVDSSLENEIVKTEFIKGYKLNNRVIRPAKVKVAKPE